MSTSASLASDADAGALPDAGTSADGGINLCDRLLVDRVRLVVRRIDLERGTSGVDAGSDGGVDAGESDGGDAGSSAADAGLESCECGDDDEKVCVKPGGDVHIGPFLVDVQGSQLTSGVREVFDVEVPQGTYDEVRFVINTLSRHQAADGGLAEMKDLHASIAVDGVFAGAPFQFTTPLRVQQKQEGPFVVADGTKNITLIVDPSGWFVGTDGQVLDPNDPTNRGTINANIRCSVRMFSKESGSDGGQSSMREFDDDDRGDMCEEDEDDDHGDGESQTQSSSIVSVNLGVDHSGESDAGGDGHHQACGSTPPVVCGDGGVP